LFGGVLAVRGAEIITSYLAGRSQRRVMNSSLWTADRNTHLKIVAITLVTAITIMAVGLNARNFDTASVTVDVQVVPMGKS
jgi:hypothetical protein